jgi:hypothetical protein
MRIWSRNAPYEIDNGAEFYGTGGKMVLSKRGISDFVDDRGRPIEMMPDTGPKLLNHQEDFADAIRVGRRPNADIEIGHRAVAVVHLGNIACRVGRALEFDTKTERIVGDDEANRLLSRTYRKGGHWAVPQGA